MRPHPHFSFQCGSIDGSLMPPTAFGRITEELLDFVCSSEGSASSMRATTPEASGVAMLVPSFES